MPFHPQDPHEIKWLAPLGQIRWEAEPFKGELLALSEKFLQISCQDAKFSLLTRAKLKISYSSMDFHLSGTLKAQKTIPMLYTPNLK